MKNRESNVLSLLEDRTNSYANKIALGIKTSYGWKEFTYNAVVDEAFKRKAVPAEECLRLKRGAKIMMLANDEHWVNGDIGTVYDLGPDFIKVELKGSIYQVEPYIWEDVKCS